MKLKSILIGLAAFLAQSALACDPTTSACQFKYVVSGSNFVYYYANADFAVANPSIKTLIIGIEGNERKPASTLKNLYRSAKDANHLKDTLMIAPAFKGNDYGGKTTCTDGDCDAVAANELYWSTDGWKQGDNALIGSKTSSFALVDQMLQKIVASNTFPALTQVFIAGHSAGGQFTQRYALGSDLETKINLSVGYLVANPSSYLYLDAKRPTWANVVTGNKYPAYGLGYDKPLIPSFLDPYNRSVSPYVELQDFNKIGKSLSSTGSDCGCTGSPPCSYEQFKYGFDIEPIDTSHYMCFTDSYQKCGSLTTDKIAAYLKKKVFYLLGQLDRCSNPDANSDLDTSCGGNFQGPDRVSRGMYYYESLNQFGAHSHQIGFVAQAGHSASLMLPSYQAKRFFWGGAIPVKEYLAPTYTIRQKANGRYLDASTSSPYSATTQTAQTDTTQNWVITKVGDGLYTLEQLKTLRYLQPSSTYAVSAQLYDPAAQIWLIQAVSGEANTYTIQHKLSGRYLDADLSRYTVTTETQQTDGTQKWVIQ